MIKTALLVLSFVLLSGPGPRNDGERLRDITGTEANDGAVLPELLPNARAQLVSRTGVPMDVLDDIRCYRLPAADDAGMFRVAFIDANWNGREVRVGAALDPSGGIRRVAAFDEYGKVIEALEPFLSQFQGRFGLRLTDASDDPIGYAIGLRDEILAQEKPPRKKDERKRWVMLQHRLLMWESDDLLAAFEQARTEDETLAPHVRRIGDHLDELDTFASHLKSVMTAKDVGSYRGFVEEFRGDLDAATVQLEKDPERGAKLAKTKIKMGCGKCHGWDGNEWRKPLQGAFRDEREELGIEDGVFVVDIDVRTAGLRDDDAQALASAVKAALIAARDA